MEYSINDPSFKEIMFMIGAFHEGWLGCLKNAGALPG
jgi:hypothetical protein